MARRKLAGLRVIVTGASQGIGRALAVEAANRGMKVVAAARKTELLEQLKREHPAIEIVTADVTSPAERQAMIDTALSKFGGLDVLINNAGIGATGHFMDSDPDTLRQIFEVNYFGLCEITRLAIPQLKKGVSPAIVMISSVVGRRAIPARGLYASSKFAVAGFSEAIRAELAKDNIDVVVINPGLTQTNFSQNMLEAKAKMQMDHMRGMTSEEVASATLDALAKGKYEVTLTFKGKMMVLTSRFAPWIVDYFSKKKVRELFADEMAARKQYS
jgi:short-subunit dehydrogenase